MHSPAEYVKAREGTVDYWQTGSDYFCCHLLTLLAPTARYNEPQFRNIVKPSRLTLIKMGFGDFCQKRKFNILTSLDLRLIRYMPP
jgi:hypothetical protein